MVRWATYAHTTETPQLVWDPGRWALPVPWEGVAVLVIMIALSPAWLVTLGGQRLSLALIVGLGFVWACINAWLIWRWRLRRRRKLPTLRPQDWVCANCLHTARDASPRAERAT